MRVQCPVWGEKDELDVAADDWLVGQAQAGDVDAYEMLVRRHRNRIYRIALRMLADPHDAESILEAALLQIRQAVENADHGLITSADGLIRISARVVVVIARQGAKDVPGVRVALSHPLEVSAGAAGAGTAVQITLAADYGADLPDLGERVRQTVAARIRALTDLEPVDITVIIDDVFPPR